MVMNQLQAVSMNEGYRGKKKLFSAQGRALLEKLSLAPWASRRRKELLELLDQLDPKIAELTAAVEQEANKRPEALLLMTHPGVGPITGLVYVLVIGTSERFLCGKQIGGYIGLIPSEDSSAGRQRLGHISKQGNAMLRYLLGEASQAAVQPKAVRDGDTLATPITAKERSKIDKSIKKKYDGFRRRYPEVHGKVVDFITHPIEDGTLYFNLS